MKHATVYLRVKLANGSDSQGTGWFVEPGVIITNAHVLNIHGGDKRLLRGRLEAGWTLLGKISFWLVVAVLVLTGRMLRAVLLSPAGLPQWAEWLLPFIPPLLVLFWVGYLRMRSQRTMRLGLALLDLVAQELGLIKLTDANQAAPRA